MECAKCLVSITNDNISCGGFCNGKFHYTCAVVDRVALNKCQKFPNIIWFCDDCRVLLENKTFRKLFHSQDCLVQQPILTKLVDEVACNSRILQSLLATLADENKVIDPVITTPVITHITTPVTTSVATPAPTPAPAPAPTPAPTPVSSAAPMLAYELPNGNDLSVSSYAAIVFSSILTGSVSTSAYNSTSKENTTKAVATIGAVLITADTTPSGRLPISSLNDIADVCSQPKHVKPICGTNSLPSNLHIKTVAPRFWIHLSRFDPSTLEDDILSMANMCLESSNCVIHKLVPKNRELKDLSYICFKLGISEELRDKALNSDTWPTGVFIRPFQSNFRKSGLTRAKFRISPLMVNTSPA